MLKFFPGRLATVALCLLATAVLMPATTASAATRPIGRIDAVSWTGATVTLRGWSLDPAHSSNSNTVLVSVDSRAAGTWRTAGVSRPDVNTAYGASGGHGFDIAVALPNGTHQVCMLARPYNSASPIEQLGCATVKIYVAPAATVAQFRAEILRIDPHHTVVWSFDRSFGTEAGWAVGNRVNISAGLSADWLRPIVLHEWSHVLQYRAFGSANNSMSTAVAAFDAVAGTTGSYGIEHGADCMALSLGATKLGYGCPAVLKVFAGLIANGLRMTRPIGGVTAATVVGGVFCASGWVFDPANPRKSDTVQVADNGRAATGWITTSGLSQQTNSHYGIPGRHGLSVAVRLSAGSHRLCVNARSLVGSAVVNLHCWTEVVR